jgi:zinc transporter 1/2/3
MFSVFSIFIVELIAFRWGTSKLARLGVHYGSTLSGSIWFYLPPLPFPDAHGHSHGSHAAHGPEGMFTAPESGNHEHVEDPEKQAAHLDSAAAQIIGVAILEFGVLLHRYCHQNNLTSSSG